MWIDWYRSEHVNFTFYVPLKTGRASGTNLKLVLVPQPDISQFLRSFPVHSGNVSVSHDLHDRKTKHPTIRRGVQQIEFPSSFYLWSDPILLLEKATESIAGRNVRFHLRSKFSYWYRKRALNRSQVWGWDIVPGRSHVNSSGWSFCILWSCIFTAHNPTKICFLRRITNFTSCRPYANI